MKIINTPENRIAILQYLEQVDEDTFIDEFVIPLFRSQGYYLFRINDHGPGEHGKDLIFYKHIPVFYDNEYVVVQAKAEKITTNNVNQASEQIKRALKISFLPKSGGGELQPHYAIFINARTHTNDGDYEFQKLIKDIPHIKIWSQENVCEIIMRTGICPETLKSKLSISEDTSLSEEDRKVYNTILDGNPSEIDKLLDHRLKFIKEHLGSLTKSVIIDYIFDRWQMDRSWSGTVKPMQWFDRYFDFFTEKHSEYLLEIFQELTSSTPSFEALPYTISVVRKITPKLLYPIEKEFIKYCGERVLSYPKKRLDILIKKLSEYSKSKITKSTDLKKLMELVLDVYEAQQHHKADKKKLEERLYFKLYPEEQKDR